MYVDFTELKNISDPHARSSAFYKLAVECKNIASHECCPYVNTMSTPEKPENRAFSEDQRMHTPVISAG